MIWLVGGTGSSREISEHLKKNNIGHIVTVATEYGKKLYTGVDVRVGRLDREGMVKFIEDNHISVVVDATHPYAVEVSRNTIDAASEKKVSHLRFEREMCDYRSGKKFDTYEEVTDYLSGKKGNVLVTTGSNNLSAFGEEDTARYYFRILPVEVSIRKAIDAGISPKNIIAIQGPFAAEFNRAIIKNYSIEYLITKESGREGGEGEKIEACVKEGIELLVIKRPQVNYKKVVYRVQDLVEEIRAIKGE